MRSATERERRPRLTTLAKLGGGGERIGRYVVFEQIGGGGMATVHLGRLLGPAGFARPVAIKRIRADFARDPELLAAFTNEALVTARIRHPNVVETLDVIALPSELLIVMEYVEGEALSTIFESMCKRAEAMPIRIACSIMCQALHGLHAAHEATSESAVPLAIVHRDVSPHNIILGTDGAARVLDFGIAKAAERSAPATGERIRGKRRYMAPEHARGEATDRRADVFATGLVLWELLTGRRLFDGVPPERILGEMARAAERPPSAHRPEIPAALDAIVARALAVDPAARFGTAEAMALSLEEAMGIDSTSKIGSWMRELTRTTLAERAALVSRMERGQDGREDTATYADVPCAPSSVRCAAPPASYSRLTASMVGPPPQHPNAVEESLDGCTDPTPERAHPDPTELMTESPCEAPHTWEETWTPISEPAAKHARRSPSMLLALLAGLAVAGLFVVSLRAPLHMEARSRPLPASSSPPVSSVATPSPVVSEASTALAPGIVPAAHSASPIPVRAPVPTGRKASPRRIASQPSPVATTPASADDPFRTWR